MCKVFCFKDVSRQGSDALLDLCRHERALLWMPEDRVRRLFWGVLALANGIGALSLAWVLWGGEAATPRHEALAGWPILTLNADDLDDLTEGGLRDLNARAAARQRACQDKGLVLVAGEKRLPLTWGAFEPRVFPLRDESEWRALVLQGWTFGAPNDEGLILGLNEAKVEAQLRYFEALERAPLEARWDFSANRLWGSVEGRRFNIQAAMALVFDDPCQLEQLDLPLEIVKPRAALELLGGFGDLVPLARYETSYNTRKRARVTNLRLAAAALNGTILMPGQSVGYNELVGERSEARGFLDAPVISQGEVVEGIGGGACQVSSTLHAAALFAGLEIVERYNHSLPSSYIPMGFDSVVSWPSLDLRIANPYDFPVALQLELDEGELKAVVWGTQQGDRVIVRREILEEIPFVQQVTVDPNLEPETIKIRRRGRVGYRVNRARMIWRDGEEVFERLMMDTYRAQAQLVTIGPETVYPPQPEAEDGSMAPAIVPP